jgi:KipI family sensor histidine kinase inhibitor
MARASAEKADGPGRIMPAGDSAIIVRLGTDISLATHARVMELLRRLDLSGPPPGVLDVVPAYASVMVIFDPLLTSYVDLEERLLALLQTMRPVARVSRRGRLVRIPVEYGGSAGPDLADVAELSGLLPKEVVQKHSSAEYRVYFLGFQSGFPYLGGLPSELAVPRLARPRPEVPAGSVGLAGRQTGIYPVAAPGGWRLIGRTRRRLFDPRRNPPALLRPGDRVKFEVIPSAQIGASTDASTSRTAPGPTDKMQGGSGIPWLAVQRPGPQSTVQDLGRHGYARYGVCVSGAADTDALLLGNALLQNPPGAAGLELTLGGGEFEVLASCEVVVTGAECEVLAGGRKMPLRIPWHLAAGDRLQVGIALRGARVYLCVQGGVQVESVLGSCSTDIRAGMGGIDGRVLRSGDILRRGTALAPAGIVRGLPAWLQAPHYLPPDGSWVIRILPSPESSRPPLFQPAAPGESECGLLPGTYTVDPSSDRVGVRLHPSQVPSDPLPYLNAEMTEKISEGVPLGAMQLLPSGEAIILLADHQTTGGYPVGAVVASVDMWRVAQLRPGDRVRFRLISPESAVHLLRQSRERLVRSADASSGVYEPTPSRLEPGVEELLMRGFSEWSDDDDDSYDL